MTGNYTNEQQFLIDLFTGPFRGHAIIAEPTGLQFDWSDGDAAISSRPVSDWAPQFVHNYEVLLKWHETLGDDNVPCASLTTGTELFAAAFGCPVHIFGDNVPCALPLVSTAEEADALRIPDLSARPLERIFELAQIVRERVGPDVPIGVPDIQSPFDVAALIWRKEDFLVALYESPDAVKRLTMKCHTLLKEFLTEFRRQVPNCNLCHHPRLWLPPELGCWLSEDEAGSMNAPMFREFCLPSLVDLSETFNGLSMHCCATARSSIRELSCYPKPARHEPVIPGAGSASGD